MNRRLTCDDVREGDELPPLVVTMTPTRIVAGALATRDFMPAHHDRDFAKDQGAPDIFLNIISTTAYCSRFLTDWAGPDAMIKRLATRLGVPALPGSTLNFTGRVAGVAISDDRGLVEVEFRAANDLGDHVTGTATVSLLSRA